MVGILTVIEEFEVKNVIIGKQFENSENYQKFLKIVQEKNIQVMQVKKGDKVVIEKDLYIDIIWPSQNEVSENSLNNNSLVCKLNYKNFSILFTGDIEKIAEERIIKEVNTNLLKSNILKVGHHGSKTSTIQDFLNIVKPDIALIGVGKSNKFGHPNRDVLDRLEEVRGKNI